MFKRNKEKPATGSTATAPARIHEQAVPSQPQPIEGVMLQFLRRAKEEKRQEIVTAEAVIAQLENQYGKIEQHISWWERHQEAEEQFVFLEELRKNRAANER